MVENEVPIPDPGEAADQLLDPSKLPPNHRAGFVALVGRPNVGKSTLMNRLIGERLAIVTPKAQTTRRRMLGILTLPDMQVVFMDTPGLHKPVDSLGKAMVHAAEGAINDADLVLFMIDAAEGWTVEDQRVAEVIQRASPDQLMIVLNKIDVIGNSDTLTERIKALVEPFPDAPVIELSALHGDGMDTFVEAIAERLPLGPRFFPEDQLADWPLRDVAMEMIREQVLLNLHQEVPYAVEVALESWEDVRPNLTVIRALLFVERDSQKGIVIGRGGSMLKTITQGARRSLESLIEHRVKLILTVRVQRSWRKDKAFLKRLGLA